MAKKFSRASSENSLFDNQNNSMQLDRRGAMKLNLKITKKLGKEVRYGKKGIYIFIYSCCHLHRRLRLSTGPDGRLMGLNSIGRAN
ncbi:MAG: hypothetical protein ACK5QW_02685 [Cyanobacteriota bacterium]|jgi:hypothetical protein